MACIEIYRLYYSILSPESQSFFGKINSSFEKVPETPCIFLRIVYNEIIAKSERNDSVL